jgi:PIN domain nuclease of toxin-antitoxin system
VIVLDTHIWWIHGDAKLSPLHRSFIQQEEANGLGISAISCWEIAKAVEYGRLTLPVTIDQWFNLALGYPGMHLLELTPQISIESTRLPGAFHRDPADQIIVATARVYNCAIVTIDAKILAYPHVQKKP